MFNSVHTFNVAVVAFYNSSELLKKRKILGKRLNLKWIIFCTKKRSLLAYISKNLYKSYYDITFPTELNESELLKMQGIMRNFVSKHMVRM